MLLIGLVNKGGLVEWAVQKHKRLLICLHAECQVKTPSWEQLKQGVSYFFLNLATPVTFYWAFHEWGPKAAIGFAVGVSILQLLTHVVFRVRPSPIFIFASGFTVVFGGIDLWIKTPQFYRFEPFAQNFGVATFFLFATWAGLPLAYEVAKALPKPVQPKFRTPDDPALKRLTWIWIVYLYLKSGFYLFLAFRVDLANLILLRTLIGGGSMAVMILAVPFNLLRKKNRDE